jgi:hypothetical protein
MPGIDPVLRSRVRDVNEAPDLSPVSGQKKARDPGQGKVARANERGNLVSEGSMAARHGLGVKIRETSNTWIPRNPCNLRVKNL